MENYKGDYIQIDLIEMIWLKTMVNHVAEYLEYFYKKQKRKPNKEKGIEVFSIEIYKVLKDYKDISRLLLIFFDTSLVSTKSMFIKDKKINNYFYECFKFLNKINDIDEDDLKKVFKKQYYKNTFYEVFSEVPHFKKEKSLRKVFSVLLKYS